MMPKGPYPFFTVFTPTFNRAGVLYRVYDSLRAQSFRDFEWLIVDDGSTDDTGTLVAAWQAVSDFPIRYVWQANGHKKTAFNHGVRLARGVLFLPADSDDSFPPDALAVLAAHWLAIPEQAREGFSGVCGLCKDELGERVGDPFPGGWGIDASPQEIKHRYKVRGEKWGGTRTDLLRANPFPEQLPGHVPENAVWSVIGRRYQTRFINHLVRVYHQGADNQLTQTGDPGAQAPGALFAKYVTLSHEIDWFWQHPLFFILEAARWTRFRLHVKRLRELNTRFWPTSLRGGALVILFAPLGLVWWLCDRWRAN